MNKEVEETWRDIKNYNSLYQVSNKGRVKSLKFGKERILKKYHTNNQGKYFLVGLTKKSKTRNILVARLVADAFIPNIDNKPCVNHINGNRIDNRVENLEWCTYKENSEHAWRTKLYKTNKKVLMKTLGDEPILVFDSQSEAYRSTGINQSTISKCCRGIIESVRGFKWEFYIKGEIK